MTKTVEIKVTKRVGKLTIYSVGIRESGPRFMTCQQEFYGAKSKTQAEAYAAWLQHLLNLEQIASNG